MIEMMSEQFKINDLVRFGMAMDFLRQWGMVVAETRRQDASGRAIMDAMPVEDVIDRAFIMADMAVGRAIENGWITPREDPTA